MFIEIEINLMENGKIIKYIKDRLLKIIIMEINMMENIKII